MDKTHDVIFVNEFLWYDVDLNLDVLWAVKGCTEVEVGEVHGHESCIWFQAQLLKRSLAVSSEPVRVPQSPRYAIVLPPMGIRVRLGSSLVGRYLQTTLVWATSLIQLSGMSLK